MKTMFPIFAFISLCFVFSVAQYFFNVINHYYNWVHFYFGLATPLLLGYFPTTLFRWNGWQHLPGNKNWSFNWRWSPWTGMTGTFLMSFINEVIDDPTQIGIPFFEAWHHFAADMIGLAFFAIVFIILCLSGLTLHSRPTR